jgi:hypothetical protein
MAIVGSDFHADIYKVKKFLDYKPEEEHVCLGDVVDSFTHPPEQGAICLKLLTTSNCVLIYGNHELSYLMTSMRCSGRTSIGSELYPKYLMEERWQVAHEADGYLLTHAGLHGKVPNLRCKTAEAVAKKLNKAFTKRDSWLFNIGFCRGGYTHSGGIFWYDYQHDMAKLNTKFNQVFGHTQSKEPWEDKTEEYHHVCINLRDTQEEFALFDTKTKEIVLL